jgi:hypothetical protein
MAEFDEVRHRAIARAVHGPGVSAPAARRAAFDGDAVDAGVAALLKKVRERAWEISDGDVEAALDAGVSEDEVFELVVCAALGQAQRQLDAACQALDGASGHEPPTHGAHRDCTESGGT